MLVRPVIAATPVLPEEAAGKEDGQKMQKEIQHCTEALPLAWQRRMKLQLARWEKIFSKDYFDVGCAKSAQHKIQLQEDKPFRERARRILLSNLEDLREQLAELKGSRVIQLSRSRTPLLWCKRRMGHCTCTSTTGL